MMDEAPTYAINYQPLVGIAEMLDVQRVIDDVTEPLSITGTSMTTRTNSSSFSTGYSASSSRAWTPSN